MGNNLIRLQESSHILLAKANQWKKAGGFKHGGSPCEAWIRNRHCIHYAKARYKKFKPEIDLIVKEMGLQDLNRP